MIALFHFPWDIHSHLLDFAVIDNIWLYTDFFFVLSGFIIAASYQESLRDGNGAWRFFLLRIGRLYPLHVAVLAAFILRDGLVVMASAAGLPGMSPQFQHDDLQRIFSYLGMLQGFPQLQSNEWNSPSWSISAEFCSYVVFAGLVALCGRRVVAGFVLVAIVSSSAFWLLVMQPGVDRLGLYTEFGVLRSLCAFSIGAIAWNLQKTIRLVLDGKHEVALVLLTVACVMLVPEAAVLLVGPYLCAVLVMQFSHEAGPLSWLLRRKPLRLLGRLSYSIYMTHTILIQSGLDAMWALDHLFGIGPAQLDHLAGNPWKGDVVALLYLSALIGISALTYRYIEVPARDWFRRLAGARVPVLGALGRG